MRGPGGGYQLHQPLHTLSINTIISAVDEDMDATRCHSKGNCQGGQRCLTHHLWCELSQSIRLFLSHITLEDLMKKPEVQHLLQAQKEAAALQKQPHDQPIQRSGQ